MSKGLSINIETLYRLAYHGRRLYFISLVLVFLSSSASAAEGIFSKLVSKEGENKTAMTGQPEKVEIKKYNVVLPAMDPLDEEAEGRVMALEGVVSGRNNYGLAVEYDVDAAKGSSSEMWCNLLQETKFTGVKSILELQEGDKVRVTYKELKDKTKNLLKTVTLVQKKPKEEPALVSPVAEDQNE